MMNNEIEQKIQNIEKNIDSMNETFKKRIQKDNAKIKNLKIIILCITFVLSISIIGNIYCVYEMSKYELVETTTEEYDIEQKTNGNSKINNVDGNQYNDKATHNENKGSKK